MEYVPGCDPERLISPVELLTNVNPPGLAVNTPPGVVTVGVGFVALLQKLFEEYANCALPVVVNVMFCVVVVGHGPPEIM